MRKDMRTFYIILAGQFISIIGSSLTGLGMGFWILDQTGTITGFAINLLMFTIPGILFSPLAGVITDKMNRKWAMVIADVGAAVGTLGILSLLLLGSLQVWHVYVLVFISQTFATLQWPAYSAAITQLVDKDNLGRASGLVDMSQALPRLFVPPIAGVLYLSGGLSIIIAVDFITFFAAVGALLFVSIPDPVRSEAGGEADKGSIWEQMAFGWHYIRERPSLLGLLLFFAAFNFLFGMFDPLLLPTLLQEYSEAAVGLAASAVGIGMVAGTIIMSSWGGPKRRVLGVLIPAVWTFFFVFMMGTTTNIYLLVVYGFMMMMVMPILGGSSQAFWQAKTEQDIQGRVFAVRRVIAQFTSPLSLLLVGPLADKILTPLATGPLNGFLGVEYGGSLGFLVLGSLGIVTALVALSVPKIRNADLILPDVEKKEDQVTVTEDLVAQPAA